MADLAGIKTAYLSFTGIIEPGGVGRIASAFNIAVNNSYDEVVLCFSSPGGLVADGIFLYNHIRSLPIKAIMYNTGSVASIAAAVFVAAEERYCSKHAVFMIHPTTLQSNENMSAIRLQSSLNAALADDGRTENILRERTGIPDAVLQSRLSTEVYITPANALSYGIVQDVREFALPKGNQIIHI